VNTGKFASTVLFMNIKKLRTQEQHLPLLEFPANRYQIADLGKYKTPHPIDPDDNPNQIEWGGFKEGQSVSTRLPSKGVYPRNRGDTPPVNPQTAFVLSLIIITQWNSSTPSEPA